MIIPHKEEPHALPAYISGFTEIDAASIPDAGICGIMNHKKGGGSVGHTEQNRHAAGQD